MILESLLELVETLKARIDAHGDQLRQSEALTRYALIDPLLRELGWNTGDPASVIPEYQTGNGKADYALLGNEKPVMMVEAKKLGTQLSPVVDQVVNYCWKEGTEYFSVTDGQRWEVYETLRPGGIDDKRIVEFDLRHSSPGEFCLKALALWRPSVQARHVAPVHESVVSVIGEGSQLKESTVTDISAPPHDDDYEWHELSSVTSSSGQNPAELLFPDGNRTQLKNWSFAPVEVVRWLMAKGVLNASHCPIMSKAPRTFRHMVHTQPIHKNGAPFKRPTEVNGLYVERFDNITALIRKTQFIIEQRDQDLSNFKVRFS